ncbi:MAG TPA: RDD family protein [Thermomicrobiaceae bacterium]|nr:RDD family protein [Thermomicrobiaceae bacterium]
MTGWLREVTRVREVGRVRGVYRTPDGRRAARYASFVQRFGAGVIDWMICGFVPFILTGVASSYVWNTDQHGGFASTNLLGGLWLAAVALCIVTYFTVLVARGATFGMWILGMRVLNPRIGRPPGVGRALIRALLALAFGFAFYVMVNSAFSDPAAGAHPTLNRAIGFGALAVFAAGFWARIWMLFDRRSQTAQDHLAGVVVLDEMIDVPENLERYRASLDGAAAPRPVTASRYGRTIAGARSLQSTQSQRTAAGDIPNPRAPRARTHRKKR